MRDIIASLDRIAQELEDGSHSDLARQIDAVSNEVEASIAEAQANAIAEAAAKGKVHALGVLEGLSVKEIQEAIEFIISSPNSMFGDTDAVRRSRAHNTSGAFPEGSPKYAFGTPDPAVVGSVIAILRDHLKLPDEALLQKSPEELLRAVLEAKG